MLTVATSGSKWAPSTSAGPCAADRSRFVRSRKTEGDVTNYNHHHYPPHGPRLRFCRRATVNVRLAFGLAQVLPVPQHGLWTVLTAVVVIQMSIRGWAQAGAPKNAG